MSSPPSTIRRRWPRRLAIGVGIVIVLAIAVPFSYIHLVEKSAPPKLALTPAQAVGTIDTGGSGGGSVTGTWNVDGASLVGYRVNETLLGQKTTAVGRTSAVTGALVVTTTSVESATFTAQMATVKSNESQRDVQFDGRIMDVSSYPTATFTLTKPIALTSVPAVGTVHAYTATGNLTLRGQTRPVTFTMSAVRTSTGLEIQGDIPILFANWKVPNPSFGSFVKTADSGTLEFLLKFGRGTAATTTTTAPATATATPTGSPGSAPAGGYGAIKVSPTTTPPLTIGG